MVVWMKSLIEMILAAGDEFGDEGNGVVCGESSEFLGCGAG
jgi:hypothetical protein